MIWFDPRRPIHEQIDDDTGRWVHPETFATLQRQFDDLRKIIEQRNAEIATLKARIDALERKE